VTISKSGHNLDIGADMPEIFDIREARKEIAALKHDVERLYGSLNAEANARIASLYT
jgi:uncharacterized small protein (DUF1192 family)